MSEDDGGKDGGSDGGKKGGTVMNQASDDRASSVTAAPSALRIWGRIRDHRHGAARITHVIRIRIPQRICLVMPARLPDALVIRRI